MKGSWGSHATCDKESSQGCVPRSSSARQWSLVWRMELWKLSGLSGEAAEDSQLLSSLGGV